MRTCVTTGAVRQEDFDGRRVRALISAETLDRSSEVLLAAGAQLDNYRRNPVVLWHHDASLPPIGRALEVAPEPGVGLWAVNEFAPTPFAQEVCELYRGGFLNAFSVGFRPLEIDRRPVTAGQRGPTVLRWELIEQSAVAVPANPQALVAAADGGNRAADWLLKTYYRPADEVALLREVGIDSPEPSWPELAAGVCRLFGRRGGVPLGSAERDRLTAGLRGLYERRGLTFPTAGATARETVYHHREPLLFEEREMAELAALLRGRSEALRNIARKRRRLAEPLPELDPVREAAANLAEVLSPGGDPSAGGAYEALAELREELANLRDRRRLAVASSLDDLRRGAIGGALPRPSQAQGA